MEHGEIPKEVGAIGSRLIEAGFEAYAVGGCVRDMLLGKVPADWDIATNARPEDIQRLFPDSFYENKFGTVTVVTTSKKGSLRHIEVTPYRAETVYSDRRHPDNIKFARTIEQDLKRRDFTINAMALQIPEIRHQKPDFKVVDLFGGQKDIEDKLIRAVGNPEERFKEDALRLLRAVRIATQLDFDIEPHTARAMAKHANLLQAVSAERIRDEFSKLVMSDMPERGIEILRELQLLPYVMKELEEGYGIGQNKHHIFTVWEHNLNALKYAAEKKWPFDVRLAALLHDVAKPRCKSGDGPDSTFYGHDVVGAKMATQMLGRLKYPKDFTEKVSKLVRYHLFYYNVDEVTESSVRRLIAKVGLEDMEDLIRVRICDRIGSGVPKAEPYKLRHFRFLVEKLSRDPVSVKMLRLKGDDVMKITGIPPGPKVGFLLNILLEEAIDDPTLNQKQKLEKRVNELGAMSDEELKKLAADAKKKTIALEEQEVGTIKKRHWVK
ncbi:MAG: polynucleotide adenylyltransferase/metal dependent phosphohydrolase [Parcubacteria group bacterium Gr01-1014_29]|nr:MAG: polynucleotide adenylyltransferase/metal dependent phosphohydrolase [Parcubacteria group bacterium Gr01-1014_29]